MTAGAGPRSGLAVGLSALMLAYALLVLKQLEGLLHIALPLDSTACAALHLWYIAFTTPQGPGRTVA